MSKYEIENVKLTAPKLDRKDLEYAMTYRYACKKFDSTKKISDEDWNAILQAARLSPTSLGFEAYQLLVIQNPEIREKMKAYGWGILAELRLTAERLLRDKRIGTDRTGVHLVVDHVAQFEHVGHADGGRLVETLARLAVVEVGAAAARDTCLGGILVDLVERSAVEDRRGELHAQLASTICFPVMMSTNGISFRFS